MHYAYMPCHETIASLHELRCRNYELPLKLRIMRDEIAPRTEYPRRTDHGRLRHVVDRQHPQH